MFGRAMTAAPLLGALLLAGCGGGGDTQSGEMRNQQAGQGITVGEPNGGVPVASAFIKIAQEEPCSDVRNRLYLIDNKQVFWDRAGNCADNSYARRLFGASPEAVLCQVSDGIAGPKTFCSDEASRAMFETIQKNLDKPDLGLGAGHKVEPITFLPRSGSTIGFESVVRDAFSGVSEAKQVVIKDAAAWEKLWAEHAKYRVPTPELPKVDFSQHMLLGLFTGDSANSCHSTGIVRVASKDGKMVVEYEKRVVDAGAICLPVVTQPMHVVAVERNDAPVEFVEVKAGPLAFKTVEQTSRSDIERARTEVVRDQEAWAKLWAEHAGPDAALPKIDFAEQMVIGVFMGTQESGCYSTTITDVLRYGSSIIAAHVDTVPGKDVMCTKAITAPAHIVVTARSDLAVEFAKEVRILE